jgi:PadR family transcriptional regulator PadR
MKELTKIEEILLVAIWHLDDKAYGVKIRQFVTKSLGKELTYGHLYSTLNQMVLKKYLTKSVGKASSQRMGRPRIYYSISREGQAALREAKLLSERIWSGISLYALEQKK